MEMSISVTIYRNSVWVSSLEVVTLLYNLWTHCKMFIILSLILITGKYCVAQCSSFHTGQVLPIRILFHLQE